MLYRNHHLTILCAILELAEPNKLASFNHIRLVGSLKNPVTLILMSYSQICHVLVLSTCVTERYNGALRFWGFGYDNKWRFVNFRMIVIIKLSAPFLRAILFETWSHSAVISSLD